MGANPASAPMKLHLTASNGRFAVTGHAPGRVDHLRRGRCGQLADRGDAPVTHGDVDAAARRAGAVDERAAAHQQVERVARSIGSHRVPFSGFFPFAYPTSTENAKHNGKKTETTGYAFPWGFAPFPFPAQQTQAA